MRKIEEAVSLFWKTDTPRTFYNTIITNDKNVTKMFLHRNLIATKVKVMERNEEVCYIIVTTKSWNTITTRSRLNCIDYKLNFRIKDGKMRVEYDHRHYPVPDSGYLIFKYKDDKYESVGVFDEFKLKEVKTDEGDNFFRLTYW